MNKTFFTATENKRPKISATTQLRLWLDAGGRCEYPTCNKPLYVEGITLKAANLANIAHIVSFSPQGPRGDAVRSPQLKTDISNLMLMCYEHHRLIDHEALADHPDSLLQQYKAEHEQRVKALLSITNNRKTYILRLQADIGKTPVVVDQSEVETAIAFERRYPADEKGILIQIPNLTGVIDECYWKKSVEQIEFQVRDAFRLGTTERNIHHLSIFAVGPMPLLAYLGRCVSEIRAIDIYQLARDSRRWKWKRSNPSQLLHKVNCPAVTQPKRKVALLLSLSDKITAAKYGSVIDGSFDIYEIFVDTPSPQYLQTKKQLIDFEIRYREVLNKIQEVHGPDCEVHMLMAVPVAIAVACGKTLLIRKDPTIWVYYYDISNGGFNKVLRIN